MYSTSLCCHGWSFDIVKFLTVDKHCDPMCRDSVQETPLHIAAQYGHVEVVKFLTLDMHCDPTSRNAYNEVALHLAVVNGHLDIIIFFLFLSRIVTRAFQVSRMKFIAWLPSLAIYM